MRFAFLHSSLILLLVLASCSHAMAQRERASVNPQELAEAELNWLSEGLSLSDAQVQRISPILLDFAGQTAQATQSAHAADWSEMRAAMQRIKHEKAEALRPFLTGDQYEGYLALQEQLEETRRQQRRR